MLVLIAACASRATGSLPDGAPLIGAIDGATVDAPSIDAVPAAVPDAVPCHGAPYPLVLQHGFFGFDNIGPINYFYGVAARLRAHGEIVVEAAVEPFASSETRAAQLAQIVDDTLATTGACKVVIIAHSQGGLDARALASSLHHGDRIAAIATIATPHGGTRVADAVLGIIPGGSQDLLNFFAHLVGQVLDSASQRADLVASLTSLSEANVATFDAANPDVAGVAYYSVAGRSNGTLDPIECGNAVWPNPPSVDPIEPLLAATNAFLTGPGPVLHPNDGMVTVASAKHGTFLGCIPADHFDEFGQIADTGPNPGSGWDHLVFYDQLVAYLRGQGF